MAEIFVSHALIRHRMREIKDLVAELESLLKLSGIRPMTGDFDIAGNRILSDYLSLAFGSSALGIWDRAGTTLRNIGCATTSMSGFQCLSNTGFFYARNRDGAYVKFYGRATGVGLQEVARLEGDTIPCLDISKAGDIAFQAGKHLKLYNCTRNYDISGLNSPLTVNFGLAEPDTNFLILIGWNKPTTIYWTNKTVNGFNITFVPSPATAGSLVDFAIARSSW